MAIDGNTGIYPLLGDPIGHARTPALYNEKFQDLGLNIVVVPMRIPPEKLADFIHGIRGVGNVVGLGITIPHKESLVGLVDELTDEARRCQATNVVRKTQDGRLIGTQMDGPGFVWSLRAAGFETAGRRALVAGAGGTAKAIGFELAASGVSELVITNRTLSRAETLVDAISSAFPNCRVSAMQSAADDFDLVVNATSLGMKTDDALPVDPEILAPETMVADVVMTPARTKLLDEAERRGCAVHPGIKMLEAQFEATVEFLGLS